MRGPMASGWARFDSYVQLPPQILAQRVLHLNTYLKIIIVQLQTEMQHGHDATYCTFQYCL